MSVEIPEPAAPLTNVKPNGVAHSTGSAAIPEAAPATAGQATRQAGRRPRLRLIALMVLAIVLVAGGVVGYGFYEDGLHYVSTDNAQITGIPVQVGAMNAGRVEAVLASVGGAVRKGDVVARVELPSQVGTTQSGTPRMDFLGAADSRVDVQAPMDGVVIATPAAVGATVVAGQPIVTLVDPGQLYVNANVEETKVERIKVGQAVTVHVDALGADLPGRVQAITPATAASFSLLPASNASGNFNKVTQLVPVRIALHGSGQPALLGSSAEVKIRVAD